MKHNHISGNGTTLDTRRMSCTKKSKVEYILAIKKIIKYHGFKVDINPDKLMSLSYKEVKSIYTELRIQAGMSTIPISGRSGY